MGWTLLFIVLGLCLLFLGAAVVLLMLWSIMAAIETLLEVFLPNWIRKHKE